MRISKLLSLMSEDQMTEIGDIEIMMQLEDTKEFRIKAVERRVTQEGTPYIVIIGTSDGL